jgi:hypothetical protein
LATENDDRVIAEAQSELARYLSDEIAPMIFTDSAEVLFNAPPEIMARGIHSWIGSQLQGPNPSAINDYLLHSGRKVHHLGELELIPKENLRTFLSELSPLLIGICPEQDRAELAANLERLDPSDADGIATKISVSKSPSSQGGRVGGGGGGGGGSLAGDVTQSGAQTAAQQMEKPPDAPTQAQSPAGSATAGPGGDQTGASIDRLNLLLDRWERVSRVTGSSSSTSIDASLAGAEQALLSRIIDEIATSARSTTDLNNQLRHLSDLGISDVGSGVFSVLSNALPDWAPAYAPPTEGEDAPQLFGAAETMKKVVDLAKDSGELNDRFSALITTAVDEFNSGSIGRAVTVIDLAQRMISQREIDGSLAANIIDQAEGRLDQAQLRRYAENEDKKLLLRRMLDFFPTLRVDNLMRDLMTEERRDRRRLILRLLMIHGEETRVRAIKILDEAISGNVPQPWYVHRNLIYLLRSIPPSGEDDIDKEIDILVRASVPGGELPLLREAFAALGQIDHPRAVKTLIARVSDLEDVLLQKGNVAHKTSEIQSLLDTAIKAMIRFDSKEAIQCLVTHGLKRRPEFGNTLSRMAMLGGHSLADDPATISRIIDAIRSELPVKVFGVAVKTSKKTQNLEYLLESLSGTDIPKIRKVYDSIVRKYPGEKFANSAAQCLTQLGSKVSLDRPSDDEGTITSLSGDLALFGLPNLLQNLADSRVEGVLTVLDDGGNSTASITLYDGMMIDADADELTGDTAIYQLLERPVLGRFIFVNQPMGITHNEGEAPGMAVMSLLMEGMRRYDEFNRAAAIIPGDGLFAATGKQPTGLLDEHDADFVNGIWARAIKGETPIKIENSSNADAYRVFRLFEHWVNESALEPKEDTAGSS